MDEPISAMPAPTSVTNEDLVPIVQSGVNYKATRSQLLTGATGEGLTVQSSANAAAQLRTPAGTAIVQVIPVAETADVHGSNIQLITANTSITMDSGSGGSIQIVFENAKSMSIGAAANHASINFNDGTRTVSITGSSGVFISYVPSTPSSWNGTPPTFLAAAVDRCAALLKTLNGGVGP